MKYAKELNIPNSCRAYMQDKLPKKTCVKSLELSTSTAKKYRAWDTEAEKQKSVIARNADIGEKFN